MRAQGDTVRYPDPWYMYKPLKNLKYPGYNYPLDWNNRIIPPTFTQLFDWTPGDTIFGVAITMDTIVNNWSGYLGPGDSIFRAVLYEVTAYESIQRDPILSVSMPRALTLRGLH